MKARPIIGILFVIAALAACERKVQDEPVAATAMPTVERFECNRCHTIEDVPAPNPTLDCTGCHRAIFTDHFANYDDDEVARWRQHVRHFRLTPSLLGVQRLRRDWVTQFLREPHNVRPGLTEQMPRLPITAEDATRIADELGVVDAEVSTQPNGDIARGAELYRSNNCAGCHRFTGSDAPPGPTFEGPAPAAQRRAPDLRYTRDRMSPDAVSQWLAGPRKVKPDALMTAVIEDPAEREHLAAYLLQTPLKTLPTPPLLELPEPDTRNVTWDEVNEAIFHATCRHCHTDGGPALPGEGGAGNTGGFGYAGAGLVLSSYEGVRRGSLNADGTRRDILARDATSVAPVVRHLMARHAEVAGQPQDDVLGMPLGLPPVTPQHIALLRAWIAQGAPR